MRVPTALLTSLMLWGPATAAMPKSPAAALKDIRKSYHDVKTLHCVFVEEFKWQLTGETIVRRGSIIVAENDRFRLETPEQLIVSDGTSVFRFNRQRNQVMVESVGNAEALLPRRLLLDFAGEFEAVEMAPLAVSGGAGFRLDMKPKDPEKSLLSAASMWVTAADLTVHRMRIEDLNGNSTTYVLEEIVFDKAVEPSATTFTPPEGAELFDLR